MKDKECDKKEFAFGVDITHFKKLEMMDDNGKHPIILNDFSKLKIRNELEKSIDDQQKKVLNNIVEDKKYKAKKEA